MKLLNKQVPIDYIYQIELTRRELQEIQNLIHNVFRYRNSLPREKEQEIIDFIDSILSSQ